MSITWIDETDIQDGEGGIKSVKPGDQVELSPKGATTFMRKFLKVPGPFTIERIGRWPCGGINLYLKMDGREPGASASSFKIAA